MPIHLKSPIFLNFVCNTSTSKKYNYKMESLQNKNALITGGSRGIGKAIATALVAEGVNVAIIGRNEETLANTAAALSGNNVKIVYAVADVADETSIAAAVQKVSGELGGIDILVNNAGIASFGNLDEMPVEQWEKIIKVNVLGLYYTTRAVLPEMKAKQSGDIINIASTAGMRASAGASAYGASKYAVMGLTEALMLEVRKFNIRVTAVAPSTVATDMTISDLKITDGNPQKVVQPEDIAELVVAQLKLNKRSFVRMSSVWSTNP